MSLEILAFLCGGLAIPSDPGSHVTNMGAFRIRLGVWDRTVNDLAFLY